MEDFSTYEEMVARLSGCEIREEKARLKKSRDNWLKWLGIIYGVASMVADAETRLQIVEKEILRRAKVCKTKYEEEGRK